ncbi:MAG TPA: amino acid permease [Acidobacteriota bacterium]|nr:amino acid permease [Acidobacteriota bacterium]
MRKTPAPETNGPAGTAGGLRRVLTHWDATALIVGIVIGSGIFATPPQIAGSLDRFGPMISVWLLGGLLALTGALTYAEMATMFPRTGGSYVFLRETFGKAPAFIFGWSALFITYPASVAAVAVVFAAYLNRLVPISPGGQPYVAAVLAIFMCGLNMLGVILGARVQRAFTAAKVTALVSLVLVPIVFMSGRWENLTPIFASPTAGWSATAWALGMAAVIWTFEGWADGPTLSGEVRNIRTDLPRALLTGTLLVTGIYILVNTAYVYVLGIPRIAATDTVAVDMATHVFGSGGALFVTLLVLVSTVGSINGMVIAGSRVFYAMARDGLFFESVGRVHPRFRTPANALGILAVVSAIYCLLGTFEQIIRYFVFIAMIWFILVTLGAIILRIRRPRADRPYRVPLYPITPILFLIVATGLAAQLFIDNTRDAIIGLGVIVLSIPIYFLWRRCCDHRAAR